ncbi:MAG: SDR family oxidoreductase [Chloroflexi bacterium]|nr:SDR family oxidoreductase [Chloroflexota bacterium]
MVQKEKLLQGKVAVVTGSGRGIGRGVVMALAENGAKVVVNDPGVAVDGTGFSKGPVDEVVEEIRRRGGIAVGNYDSVATVEGGERIIKTAVDNFGTIDILVTPAGILRDRMVFNMAEEEWDAVIAVHLKGTFAVTKNASIIMRQKRSGRIITFSSTSGLYGNSGQANYGAAKDGIAGFTRVCARDLGRYGLTVNCISPSADTRMTQTVPDTARQIRAQRGVQSAGALVPFQLVRPAEAIAPVVVWLASEEAANVNGQIFYVSGGVVGLMGHPLPVRTLQKGQGRWTVEEFAALFPSTLGMDLVNPAPPAPPPQQQPAQPAQAAR